LREITNEARPGKSSAAPGLFLTSTIPAHPWKCQMKDALRAAIDGVLDSQAWHCRRVACVAQQ
jgi:hypothetical protein